MSVLKKLASQTAVYGLSSVLGRMLNYLLVPLYTSVFLPGEYGVVTELYAYVAFLNILYVYGLETAYFRFSQESGQKYFNLAFTSILISSILLSGFIWVFAENIAALLQYSDKSHYIRWLAAIMAIDAIVAIPFAQLRQVGKAYHFAVFKLTNIGANIFLNLFFIVLCPIITEDHPEGFIASVYDPDIGVGYVFLSNLLANALYLLFFIPAWVRIKLIFDIKEWKRMMRYAWPVLIIGFAGVTNEMLSRAMLKYRLPEGFYEGYTNLEVLGIFGACYKLSVFMTLAVQAFRYAFEPFFFNQAKEKNSSVVFSQVMTVFVLFTTFSWVVLSVFLDIYAPIFLRQPSYLMALDAVPFLLGGGLLLGIFYNLSLWYKLTDHTLYGAYISLIGAVSTFILNWVLIPAYGYMGSAYATFLSYLLMVIISYLWGKKYYPVPYETWKLLVIVTVGALAIYLGRDKNLLTALAVTLSFLLIAMVVYKWPSRSK
ncbi:MAG: polysaccharide biosynthesis C-terminal domain-containing protein [Ekhidna sp.]